MSWLFEDPTWMIAAAVLIEALLAVALVKSGRAILLAVMLGVAVIASLGVVAERMVVTDRERIEATLDGVTAALANNDVQGVLDWFDPAASNVRNLVGSQMGHARITEARIYDLQVEVNRYTSPPTAQAFLVGRVKGSYRGEAPASGEGMFIRRFSVDFRQDGERWLITGYEDRGPIAGGRED